MKIYCFKLSTGEELIGSSASSMEEDKEINIENPIKIIQNNYPHYTLEFIPFMSYTKENLFTIRKKDILIYCKPSSYLVKKYKEYQSLAELDTDDYYDKLKELYDGLKGTKH